MNRVLLIGLMILWDLPSSATGISTVGGLLLLSSSDTTQFQAMNEPRALPYAASASSTNISNGASAHAEYAISSNGIQIDYSLSRPPFLAGGVPPILELAEVNGYVDFRVDSIVPYELAASLIAIDPEGRNTTLWLQLFDNGVRIFNSAQISHASPDPRFVLGGQDGDFFNEFAGVMSGSLLPNHRYRFQYYARLLDEPSPSLQTATAAGSFGLMIVPEPTVGVILMLGLSGLGILRPGGSPRAGGSGCSPSRCARGGSRSFGTTSA